MGLWVVNADTLAGSRFVISPLAEATGALMTLERGTAAHPGEGAWLGAHLPAYRERLAADPVTAVLISAALGHQAGPPRWIADFLTPTPTGEGEPAFGTELAQILATPAERAQADLTVSLRGPLPAVLRRPDLAERAASLVEWVWERAVLPDWPRRRRILEADIVARTGQLSHGGWSAALNDIRPGMRWLGGGRLQINAYDYPPRRIAGARLLFIPVTPRAGWASWEDSAEGPGEGPARYALVYGCSGVLAGTDQPATPQSLRALLGPARAGVLIWLSSPKSTTQLVALTGQGLGSVGRHLRVLADAGLIGKRRAGKSVLYYRTSAGDSLVQAALDAVSSL